MLEQERHLPEASPALTATVRLLAGVDPQVDGQVGLLAEGLLHSVHWKGLSPVWVSWWTVR